MQESLQQNKDIERQMEILKMWDFTKSYQIKGSFSDVASGINVDGQKEFFNLLMKL